MNEKEIQFENQLLFINGNININKNKISTLFSYSSKNYQEKSPTALKSILKNNRLNSMKKNQLTPKRGQEQDVVLEASILSKSSSQGYQDIYSMSQNGSPSPHNEQVFSSDGFQNIWKQKSLNILYYVSKFIRQIKTSGNKIKFKLLNTRILGLVNDAGSDSSVLLEYRDILNNVKITKQKCHFNQFFKILQLIPIIDPDQTIKIIWDILMLISVIINLIYVPLELSFDFKASDQVVLYLNTIPSWLLLLDVILTLQTAYYHEGTIHRNQAEILKNYMKGGKLMIDVLILIPILFQQYEIDILKFALLFRIVKLPKMANNLEEILNPKESIKMLIQLAKLIYFIIITCHFCACLWGLLGELQIQQNSYSWLTHYGIDGEIWTKKYIYSIYYCTITTLTIGYGDITPQTDLEKIYSILLALLVCGVLGYSVSTVGNIIKLLQDKDQEYKQKLSILTNYLKSRNLNQQLQLQVRKYFEHYLKLEQESQFKAELMMQQLTQDLKEKVAIDLYFNILKNSKVLANLCENCLKKLCLYVHEKKLAPEEKIWSPDEKGTKIYFLLKGQLDILANNIRLKTCEFGVFGEKECLTQSQYQTYLKAVKFSQLIYLNIDDIMKILYEDQQDLERFKMLQDNLIFNESFKNFGQVCEICGWTHQLNTCPFVFVKSNRNKIITINKNSKPQQRFFHDRKYYSFKTKYSLKDVQECGLAFMINEKLIEQIDCSDQYLQDLGFDISKQEEEQEDNYQQGSKQKQFQDSKFESFSKSNTFTDYFRQNDQSNYEHTNKFTNKNTNKPKSIIQNNIQNQSVQQSSQQSQLQTSIQQQQQTQASPSVVRWDSDNLKQNNQKRSTLLLRKLNKERSIKIEMRLNNKSKPSYVSTVRQETSNNKSIQRYDSVISGKHTKSIYHSNNTNSMVSPYDDMLNMFQDDQLINEENIDFNIDKQYLMIEYFPSFNYDVVIKKFDHNLITKRTKMLATISRGKTLQKYIK
ncbi:unnamed protein product [Paramecium primaurelia]|uniref:Cyclic nucleotide-binding domain-containing protein n=1 Tax=Paramecium primaurelia TaxID=5886 RepID=A0A8S1K2C4_PARPR|nr:unnamed protein product [Paramecium primaurelia]